MKAFVCLDIGGTSVKCGIVNERGDVLCRDSVDCAKQKRFAVRDAYASALSLMRKAAQGRGAPVYGVGVSATGQIDVRTGIVVGTCGNFPDWKDTDLLSMAKAVFPELPVAVANDANCAALGEWFIGAAKNVNDAVMYTVGTGIGGGVIVNGQLLGGARGLAGELGHIAMFGGTEKCTCGNAGCFESYCKTSRLVTIAESKSKIRPMTAKFVFDHLDLPEFAAALDEFTERHAVAVSSLVHLFNPTVVVIGGGISAQGEKFLAPIREKAFEKIMPAFADGLRITAAQLGNDAGLVGAAVNFLKIYPTSTGIQI